MLGPGYISKDYYQLRLFCSQSSPLPTQDNFLDFSVGPFSSFRTHISAIPPSEAPPLQ